MKNPLEENQQISSKFSSLIPNETRRFGKPLTNTYRNQDYIKYLKKKGILIFTKETTINTKNCELNDTSHLNLKSKTKRETYDDRRMRIDELYEETRYRNNPQYNIEYIREITANLKKTEVLRHNKD
jgi:hypothetical protein